MTHPIEYVTVLEQFGYKPKPRRYIQHPPPTIIQILDDVDEADGFPGLYRGVFPSLIGILACYRLAPIVAYESLKLAGMDMPEIKQPPDIITDGEPVVEDYITLVRRGIIMSAVGPILSYPFHVVSLRMMSSFIGKEKQYQTMFGTINWIIKEEGFTAFYHGMLPKILSECICICVTGVLTYYVNKHLVKTKDGRIYAVPVMGIVGYFLAYPLIAVSNCMAVSCCSQQAGISPNTPQQQSWIACLIVRCSFKTAISTPEEHTAAVPPEVLSSGESSAGTPWAVPNVPPEFLPVALLIITHPIEYVKILLQLGHEPLPVRDTTTLFFRSPARMRPNVLEYLGHIYQTDGIRGWFRGLSANLAGILVAFKLSPSLVAWGIKVTGRPVAEIMSVPDLITDNEAKYEDYYKNTRRDVIVHIATMIISYPFYVVSMRMMAAFIGKDEAYTSMPAAIASIITENSIFGFYNGFLPRIVSDIYYIVTSYILAFFVNKYLLKTKDLRKLTDPLVAVAATPITYPYPLVLSSTCMAVAGSSLKAGNPPLMPAYSSWIDCLTDLYKTSQQRRGAAIFFRYVDDEK